MKMNCVVFSVYFLFATAGAADGNIDGYHRKDGIYVKSHKRSHPDDRRYNNYSSEGRKNPYTGKKARNEMR